MSARDASLADPAVSAQVEAAAFRRLLSHLSSRSDVQNIDMMELADFCRNCLSHWYREAAADAGVDMTLAEAKERVYGMPYAEWKARYQTPRRADGDSAEPGAPAR